MKREFAQSDGRTVHFFDVDGKQWVCAASDHGPCCCLCKPVDEYLAPVLELVLERKALVRTRQDGELEFKLTAKGEAAAEDVIQTPEGADAYSEVQRYLRGER